MKDNAGIVLSKKISFNVNINGHKIISDNANKFSNNGEEAGTKKNFAKKKI